jgi:hypothetical protein
VGVVGATRCDGATAPGAPPRTAPHRVSGTAALIMQRFPELRGRDVIDRIIATADPAPGGRHGYGIVNPYRALTETGVPPNGGRPAAGPRPDAPDRRRYGGSAGAAGHHGESMLPRAIAG